MKYMVMECHPSYAILLDKEGRFLIAANLRYEVGQEVTNPVLMKKPSSSGFRLKRVLISSAAAIAACLLLLFGMNYYESYMAPYSSIFLTINPEVRMDLNRNGSVVGLAGTNDDGETLIEGYEWKGKDKVTIADELVDRAIEMGFLSEGGRVSFSIDTPDEAIFQEYGVELRSKVTEHLDGRITVEIEIFDYSNSSESSKEEQPEKVSSSPSSLPEKSSAVTSDKTSSQIVSSSSGGKGESDFKPTAGSISDHTPSSSKPSGSNTDYSDSDYGENSSMASSQPPASSKPVSDNTNYNDGNTNYNQENQNENETDDTDYSSEEQEDQESDYEEKESDEDE